MLLEDVFIIERMEILNEGKGENSNMKIRGIFQRADEENNNKRIYSKALLCREVEKLAESLNGRRLMGELDHPQHDSVKLSNVSHLITKLDFKNNDVIGEAEILDTPMGQVAKALIEGGVQIGISSRGMGTLSEGQDGKRYVNEDFRLITWDIVADPSTRGAYPTLAEGRQSILVEEILNDVLPRVTEQKVFSTLLKERLMEAAGRKLTPAIAGFENIPASKVAAAKAKEGGRRGVDPKAQQRVASELARTQAKLPGLNIDPDAAQLLAQYRERKRREKKKAIKKTGKDTSPPWHVGDSTEIFRGVRARLTEARKKKTKKTGKGQGEIKTGTATPVPPQTKEQLEKTYKAQRNVRINAPNTERGRDGPTMTGHTSY